MMKNASYLTSLIDFMQTALVQPHIRFGFKFGTVYDWSTYDQNGDNPCIDRDINGVTVDDMCMLCDASFHEGANCQAFVLPDGVVKWYTGRGLHDGVDSGSDVRTYNNAVSAGYGINFARTESFGNVTVQERIIPFMSIMESFDYSRTRDVCNRVQAIGRELNIGDLHERNWGFRPNDVEFTTPVIFDYSAGADNCSP